MATATVGVERRSAGTHHVIIILKQMLGNDLVNGTPGADRQLPFKQKPGSYSVLVCVSKFEMIRKKKKKTQHISAVRSVSEPGLPRESHVTETKLVLNIKWFKIEQHWWFFFLFLFTTGSPFSQSLTKVCSEVGLIFLLPGCIPLSRLVCSAPDGNVRRLMM